LQNTPTVTTPQVLQMGCLDEKDIITLDGRLIGQLKGAWLELPTWSVKSLVVTLNKDVVEELNVKKPMLRHADVTLDTKFVKNIGDVVQLNTDINGLTGSLTPIKT
jgi:sporulation protein YlmC with PRC-barrel domain